MVQMAWLVRALDENTDEPPLIAVHHNPDLGGVTDGQVGAIHRGINNIRPAVATVDPQLENKNSLVLILPSGLEVRCAHSVEDFHRGLD